MANGTRRIALLGEISRRATPSFGGTGLNLVRLGNAFDEAGLAVDLLVARDDHLSSYAEQPVAGVRTFALGLGSRGPQFLRLCRYLLINRPDVLLVQDSRAIDLGLAVKRLFGQRIQMICTMHSESVMRTEARESGERRKQRRFRAMAHRADLVVGVSPGIARRAGERAAFRSGRLVTIPNPACPRQEAIDDAHRHPVPRPARARVHVISAGRLSGEKDQLTLVDALGRLVQEHDKAWHLTILGEGPERASLEARAEALGVRANLHLPGFVRRPLDYMPDADVFAMSSVREAFGLVLVEALAMGLPVVSTDCPYGPRFILEEGRLGRLVPVGDPEALAAGLKASLSESVDVEALKARARSFSREATARHYMELIGQPRSAV